MHCLNNMLKRLKPLFLTGAATLLGEMTWPFVFFWSDSIGFPFIAAAISAIRRCQVMCVASSCDVEGSSKYLGIFYGLECRGQSVVEATEEPDFTGIWLAVDVE